MSGIRPGPSRPHTGKLSTAPEAQSIPGTRCERLFFCPERHMCSVQVGKHHGNSAVCANTGRCLLRMLFDGEKPPLHLERQPRPRQMLTVLPFPYQVALSPPRSFPPRQRGLDGTFPRQSSKVRFLFANAHLVRQYSSIFDTADANAIFSISITRLSAPSYGICIRIRNSRPFCAVLHSPPIGARPSHRQTHPHHACDNPDALS